MEESWQSVLAESITTPEELHKHFPACSTGLAEVIARYPLRINSYYLDLVKKHGAPLFRQAVPDMAELDDPFGLVDPLAEEELVVAANLVRKYPDRALLLAHHQCAMYCRFCTRKRKVGCREMAVAPQGLEEAFAWLEAHPQIREVLVSGGDPLLLPNEEIDHILGRLRAIQSIEIIRIGSRVPCALPMRVTPELVKILRRHHPLYINTHFNHPAELTEAAGRACALLADGGIPLGCQTVLLKGVNDEAAILKRLFLGLLRFRVKPYYLFQTDLTAGTNHFRVSTASGVRLMRDLYGHISGMAVPTFALDAPGGKGKIPLTPRYIDSYGDTLRFTNYRGESCCYPEA
ncbi:MAG: KamA family radical SAM protein [Desulfobulbaceae bacterium]|jgi:lysine 2,3-aminomutase|nr:KamA family radical SAM protein [Desulfobulbaceae bacterium]